jgi:hypothetical protein
VDQLEKLLYMEKEEKEEMRLRGELFAVVCYRVVPRVWKSD